MSGFERPEVGAPQDSGETRPLYCRMLSLRHVMPSGLLCFVFLEGAIALGALLALAELVSWWGVLVLPLLVALMVKLNDVIAGAFAVAQPNHPAPVRPPVSGVGTPDGMLSSEAATTRLPRVVDQERDVPARRPWAERMDVQQQWVRQSATRRYE